MTKISDLAELTTLADNDLFYIWDVSDPSNPDKKAQFKNMRPPGAKITNYVRAAGSIVVPALAAGVEADVGFAVVGAAPGDHVTFGLTVNLPANLAILHSWVSAADTVSVRFRNLHASVAYAGAALACVALATRSI
jgi:hypothetical protein